MAFDIAKSGFGKESVSNLDKIKMIPLDDIVKNDQNFYSMSGIDELAESIEMVGLLNPVSVIEDNGKYRLVSGHRRCAAFYILRENADPAFDAGRKYSKIPAIVLRDMDDLKETMALITANSTARELTYAEKLQQEKLLRETLTAMKAAGMKVPRNIGQYIADQIGVSRNEVSRMHSVNENLIPEAREKVDAGEMTAQQAYEMSRKPEDEQKQSVSKPEAASESLDGSLAKIDTEVIISKMKPCMKMLAEKTAGAGSKNDAVTLLKSILGNSGGCGYWAYSSGCAFGEYANMTVNLSWSKVYDYLAIYAIRCLASSMEPDTTDSEPEQTVNGWCTGTPTESGEYVAIFAYSECEFKRLAYFDSILNRWAFKKGGAEIDMECVQWLRLPDESCTDDGALKTHHQDGWISVCDRMPEYMENVLVFHISGDIEASWIDVDGQFITYEDGDLITHWMPFPDPPNPPIGAESGLHPVPDQ